MELEITLDTEAIAQEVMSELDWSDVASNVQDYLDLNDRIDREVRSQVEDIEVIDLDDVDERITGNLHSVPMDRQSRCRMGQAFTAAVDKVLRDGDNVSWIESIVREVVEPILERATVAVPAAGFVPTVGSMADELATRPADPTDTPNVDVVYVTGVMVKRANGASYGPFRDEHEANTWAEVMDDHGIRYDVDVPVVHARRLGWEV